MQTYLFYIFLLLAASPFVLSAADNLISPKPNAATSVQEARTVNVTLKSTVPIHASVLRSTLLVLPEEEKIAEVFVGDKEFWHFDTTKISTRYLSIKPLAVGVKTDLHIISDHGVSYSFLLDEASTQAGVESDSKVFIEPGDASLHDSLAELPRFVPTDQVERYRLEAAAAKAEASQAKAEAAQTVQKQQAKAAAETDSFRAGFPGQLQFAYRWNEKIGRKLGVEQIFADDKFTYIRARPQEAPALYEIKDGKPSLVNFDFNNGLYTVSKRIERGYLAVGKTRLEFWRTEPRVN